MNKRIDITMKLILLALEGLVGYWLAFQLWRYLVNVHLLFVHLAIPMATIVPLVIWRSGRRWKLFDPEKTIGIVPLMVLVLSLGFWFMVIWVYCKNVFPLIL